ncbi:Succinate dehydrogenase OS=Streptomyces rutgersensis OX=53451 GN=F0345_02185 PE=4 SV=1 [Streptomyces diastaticus subsp. diastaticus]
MPMALATRTDRRPSTIRTLWDSSVGKKTVMAVTGLIMLLYLVVHMLGNLKIFFGAGEFNGYAAWLRTMGEPFLHHEWALWIVRVVLLAAVVLHAVSAAQLSRRDIRARPVKYVHKRPRAATPPEPCAGAGSSSACSSSGTSWI